MARPTKNVKRTTQVKVAYTPAELRVIQHFASKSGLRTAQYVREKSLDHQVKSRLSTEQLDLYIQAVGMANNLNQLTRYYHANHKTLKDLPELQQQINSLLDLLRK